MAQTRTKSDILLTPNAATGYLCFYFYQNSEPIIIVTAVCNFLTVLFLQWLTI